MDWTETLRRAVALHQSGNLGPAENLYQEVLRLQPDDFDARHLLGVLRAQQSRYAEARGLIERALAIRPQDPAALASYGKVQTALGDFTGALASYDRALALRPHDPELLYARGNAQRETGDLAAAAQSYLAATQARPDFAVAWNNRGAVLRLLGRADEALACLDRAISLVRGHALAWNNRAALLIDMNRFADAADSANHAVAIKGDFAEGYANRGIAHWRLNRVDAALADFNQALALDPNLANALSNRARLLWSELREYEAAQRDLERLLSLDPDFPLARGDLFYVRASMADWSRFDEDVGVLTRAVRKGTLAVQPFIFQACATSSGDLLSCAELYANREYPARSPLTPPNARSRSKIRLGYVCGEFRSHATSHLSVGLFEQHDRDAFDVIAFDNGASDDSFTRGRLERAFDRIIAIGDMSDKKAAECIRAEDVDILVNLNGYYGAHRMGVFAHRPAPIQVNWLGFPGTLGAPYMDYIIADKTVLPEAEERYFTERVAWLPDTYQVNDSMRRIASSAPTRGQAGLPEAAFVFANFNQPYKLSPAMLQVWLRILARVPHGVLWLWSNNDAFGTNVKRFATQHGIAAERIVVAKPVPVEDHLARLRLADLFLDSLPYNAHTTASDALWVSLPLLTCTGTTFAGRVAGSLLRAAGLPELITATLEDYENRAVDLAHDPGAMQSLRDKLAAARGTCPLFDTALFRRHIESAYRSMWERVSAGLAPQSFCVPPAPIGSASASQ